MKDEVQSGDQRVFSKKTLSLNTGKLLLRTTLVSNAKL